MLIPAQLPGFPHRNGALYPQHTLGPLHSGVLPSPLCEQDASPVPGFGDSPVSRVLALQQTLGTPQRGFHPTLGCGDPPRNSCHSTMVLSPRSVSSMDTSGTKVGTSSLSCWMSPPSKGPASPGTLSHLPRIPGLLHGLLLPWPLAVMEVTGLAGTRCPIATGALGQPRASPSPCPLRGGLRGLGHCSGQGPPQPLGSLSQGHSILVLITGFCSSKHPGDAPKGVHSPALCLRARQHFVILIHYFS